MLPSIFLILVLLLSVWALTIAEVQRWRRHALARRLAGEWGMLFSPRDTLDLTGQVARLLPVPGASEVVLHDLVYGSGSGGHVYYLSAVYTVGVLGSKSRVRSVVRLGESIVPHEHACAFSLAVAPRGLGWVEQYRALKQAT